MLIWYTDLTIADCVVDLGEDAVCMACGNAYVYDLGWQAYW